MKSHLIYLNLLLILTVWFNFAVAATPHISNFDVCPESYLNTSGDCSADRPSFKYGADTAFGTLDLFNPQAEDPIVLEIIQKDTQDLIARKTITLDYKQASDDMTKLTVFLKNGNGRPLPPGSYQFTLSLPMHDKKLKRSFHIMKPTSGYTPSNQQGGVYSSSSANNRQSANTNQYSNSSNQSQVGNNHPASSIRSVQTCLNYMDTLGKCLLDQKEFHNKSPEIFVGANLVNPLKGQLVEYEWESNGRVFYNSQETVRQTYRNGKSIPLKARVVPANVPVGRYQVKIKIDGVVKGSTSINIKPF